MKLIKYMVLTALCCGQHAMGITSLAQFEEAVESMRLPLSKILGKKTLKNKSDFDLNIDLINNEIAQINAYFKNLPKTLSTNEMKTFKRVLAVYKNLELIVEVNKTNMYNNFAQKPPEFTQDEKKAANTTLSNLIFSMRDSIDYAMKKFSLKTSNIAIVQKLNDTLYTLTAKEGITFN